MNDFEALIRTQAKTIADSLKNAAARARNEADLVAEAEDLLEDFTKYLDVTLRLDRERTLVNGRADAVYNRFVIEYEPPRSLKLSKSARTNQHAITQVKQYIEELSHIERHKQERVAGVATDGDYFIFVRFRDGHWSVDDPLPVTAHSTETFLRYLSSLATETALTPENLVRDFGENTTVSRACVSTFYQALTTTTNAKAHVLFNQWQLQFSEICGYEEGSTKLDVAGLAKNYGIKTKQPDALCLFFAIHSYYATFIKLLAVQIASFYMMPKLGTGLAQVASYDRAGLHKYLTEMELGGVFKQFGINNLMEGDFFGWYLDIWDESLDQGVRRIIAELSRYSLVTLDVDPEETRDLLKRLYQKLMPKKLRHDLGEYYTPDWLAERLLNQLGYDGNPDQRLLDPNCGSGTFLVLVIKRIRQYTDDKMLPEAEVLEKILKNVVGFDLNPLAVISARTNYLLALGELLQHRRGEISIPVYLADSILTPTAGDNLFTHHEYSFNTAVGRFAVPKSLVNAGDIDRLADLLEECVQSGLTLAQFEARVMHTFPALPPKSAEVDTAKNLFAKLQELDQKQINGIWARIIKNAFAPLFAGQFDYIAGNPPWINWESLPEDYRSNSVSLWHYHGMIPPGGLKSVMGHSKMDISMLMTYVAMDKYLKDSGRLGFIITQSVFKMAGAGQGFRRFRLGSGIPIRVVLVDDMVDLKPFAGATNRTAIMVLERGQTTVYPVQYSVWYKPGGGSVISEDVTLDEIIGKKIATYRQFVAEPVGATDSTSSWITGRPRALKAVKKVLGVSHYQAREGVNTGGANGVYWLEKIDQRPNGVIIVTNLTKGAKRKVDNVQVAIEADLLYPLLRGRDVRRWKALPSAFILMTKPAGYRGKAISEEEMIIRYPKTYAYLSHFRDVLAERRDAVLMRSQGTIPFYSMGAISDYTFAPYKVLWREVSNNIQAAVVEPPSVGDKVSIPDHTLVAIATENYDEAHYLCALLNSSCANFVVVGYIALHPSPHIMSKVGIPRYDPTNPTHHQLAVLSQQAHRTTSIGDTAQVQQIEAEIDELAKKLWGLSEAELKDIQQSLAEGQ